MLEQVVEEVVTKSMDEIEIEGTDRTLYDYAYGYCSHFAIALHDKYEASINVIWGKLEGEWNLVHAYCVKNGEMKDASGDINSDVLDDYRSFFDYEEFKEEILTKDEFITKLVNMGENIDDIQNDVILLHAYIDIENKFYNFG